MPVIDSVSLEGFTSQTTGDQLFTLTGSVTGSYSGVLMLTGENLYLLDVPTVTGEQYSTVTFGDMVKDDGAAMVPVEIVSTANGGAMIQIGDAVITLAVTYVAPVPVISQVFVGDILLVKSGSTFMKYLTTSRTDMVEAFSGSRKFEVSFRIKGTNVGDITVFDSLIFSNDRGVNVHNNQVSYTTSVVDGDLYIALLGYIPQNEVPSVGVCSYGARLNVRCGNDVFALEYGYTYSFK